MTFRTCPELRKITSRKRESRIKGKRTIGDSRDRREFCRKTGKTWQRGGGNSRDQVNGQFGASIRGVWYKRGKALGKKGVHI